MMLILSFQFQIKNFLSNELLSISDLFKNLKSGKRGYYFFVTIDQNVFHLEKISFNTIQMYTTLIRIFHTHFHPKVKRLPHNRVINNFGIGLKNV